MHDWYVYLIRCRNGELYTGIATDVERRLAEHRSNKGARYLRGKGPLKLAFKKCIGERSLALRIERRIKKLPREKKEQLIQSNAGLEELFEEINSR